MTRLHIKYLIFFVILIPVLLFSQNAPDSSRIDLLPDAAFEDKPYEYQIRLKDSDSLSFKKIEGPDWLTVSADGLLSGMPGQTHNGYTSFKLLISDSLTKTDTLNARLNVIGINDRPLFRNPVLPDAVEDSSYFHRLVIFDEDDDPDSLEVRVLELPHWLKLENQFWLRGLPENNDVSDSIIVRLMVSDRQQAADTLYARIAVINSNDRPRFRPIPARTIYEDVFFSDTLFCKDEDGDSLWYRALDLPDWLTLSSAGVLNGIPGQAQVDSVQHLKIVALDGNGGSDTLATALQVANTNDRPQFITTTIRPATEDVLYQFVLSAADEDGESLIYSALNLPAWLAVDSKGVLSGTPKNKDTGNRIPLTIRVSDPAGLSDTLRTTFLVINSNDAPTIRQSALDDAFEDQHFNMQLSATDDDGDPVTFEALSLPPWLKLSADGKLSGTPLQQHVTANVPVRVLAKDGKGGLDSLIVSIGVINQNDTPHFKTKQLPDAKEDKIWQQRLVAEDEDKDPLFFEALQVPAWLTLFDDGRLEGLPRNDDVSASVAITVAVTDNNGGSDTLKTAVKVINTNDKPQITTRSLHNGREDFTYLAFVSASDEDGDVLRFKVLESPAWLKLSPEGRIEGLPLQEHVGNDITIKIEADDSNGGKDTLSLHIAVSETADAPVFTSTEIPAATEDENYQFILRARDEDSDQLQFEAIVLPSWLDLDKSGKLSGIPLNEHVSATIPMGIVVQDDSLLRDTLSTTLQVINVNDAPVIKNLPPLIFDEDDSSVVNLSEYINDEDNSFEDLTVSILNTGTANGLHFRVSGQSKNLHIRANKNLFGSFQFIVETRDPQGLSDRDTVSLTIRAVNDAPQIASIPVQSFAEDQLHKQPQRFYQRFVSDIDNPVSELQISFRGKKIHSAFNTSDSSYLFSAPADWFGHDSIMAVVSDEDGLRDSTHFAMNVLAVNDAPVFQPDSVYQLKNNEPLRLNLRHYLRDVDDFFEDMEWTFEVSSDSIVLFDSDSILTIISRDYLDRAELLVTVSDTSGASDSVLIRLNVAYPANQYDINGDGIPEKFILFQNHPNPFNGSTAIRYGLPERAEVKIDVYNTLGQKITALLSKTQKAGFHHIDWEPRSLASGLYFYRIYAKGKKRFQDIKKLVLVR